MFSLKLQVYLSNAVNWLIEIKFLESTKLKLPSQLRLTV